MRCAICRRTIGRNARRTYAYVSNGRGGTRRVYACARCEAKFDRWLETQAKENDDAIARPEDPERAT
jgi:hypothetical protein